MSANLEVKKQVVAEIVDRLERTHGAVLVDYRGLTVQEDTALRKQCREAGIEYKVLKNHLVARAAQEIGIEGLESTLKGPTAIAFSYTDPVAPAKVLSEFVKKAKKMEIKSGLLGKSVLDVKGVAALSELPPKEVVVAKLLGTLNAPVSNLVGVLAAVPRSLVTALDAIRKQKEEA